MTPKTDKKNGGCVVRGLQWLTVKLRLLEDGATPPQWKYMMLIFACFFANTFCSMFASPLLPEMILHLGKSENEKGTYVGLMTSCVFAGVFLGSMFWGWLADKKGRKCVLLLSLVFTSLSITAFSLSSTIPMALAMRFLAGLLNGIATTSRAVLYDISDDSNQAIGMAMLAFSWGVGMLAGSFVGGFLASPCSRWPNFCDQDSVFGQFPFFLPAIIPALTSLVVAFIVFIEFDETLAKTPSPRQDGTKAREDGHQTDTTKNTDTALPDCGPRALHKRPFSQYDEDRFLNFPAQSVLLSRSLTSLHPEADVTMWLGKDVLQRRDSLEQDKARNGDMPFHCYQERHDVVGSYPDINAEIDSNDMNGFHVYDWESIEITEVPSTQEKSRRPRRIRTYSDGVHISDYKSNGSGYELHEISVCAQRWHGYISNKEKQSIVEQNGHSLLHDVHVQVDGSEKICNCCDSCVKLSCPSAFFNSSLHRLLRLSDVWSTVCLYFVLCFATIGTEDIFPVFASTSSDNGGLGFSTSEIGTALGLISVPLLALQMKIYPFFVARLRIRKTYILMALVCLIDSQALPMLKILNNSPRLLWTFLMLIQATFRIATNCCFASASLLINNSVPQCLAGQANGISMTSSAVGRFIAPVAAGSLYSWSITHGQFIGAPFDAGFPFFVFGIFYGVSLLQCLIINTKLERQKK